MLTADDERLAREPPQRLAGAWVDLLVVSLAWGIVSVGLWGAVWSVFRDYGLIVRPAAAVMAAFVLVPYRRAMVAAATMLGREDPTARALAAAVLVVALTACLLGLAPNYDYYQEWALPAWIAWLRPPVRFHRVLVLMPLWGAWAMLITPKFCAPTDRTEPPVAAFARGCGPAWAAAVMGALLAATFHYFSYLPAWTQINIAAAAALTAVVGGIVLCRLSGGLGRAPLLAANLATQIAFVLAYLASR